MISRRFEELKQAGQLPTPSGVGELLLHLATDTGTKLESFVKVIAQNSVLSERVVKLAKFTASSESPVRTLPEAAERLGQRTLINASLGFSFVESNRIGSSARFDYDGFWSTSLARAVACQAISEDLGQGVPEELFTLGLLSQVGEVAMAEVDADAYDRFATMMELGSKRDRFSLEEQQFGINSREATVGLLSVWGLPLYFGQSLESLAVRDDGEGLGDTQVGTATNVLALAFAFAEFCTCDAENSGAVAGLVFQLGTLFGLKAERLDRARERIAQRWSDWGHSLSIPTRPVPPLDAASAVAPDAKPERGARGVRILAVDDDPVALRLLEKHLQRAGHEVVTARDGTEALGKALDSNPQMIITDWNMPEMDGVRFTKALRCYPQGRRMYVLLLTGQSEEDRTIEAFDAGVDDYIVKPFKPRLLMARIRAGLRVLTLQDQLEKKNEMLREWARKDREAALTDALTELPNRRYAMRVLATEWSKAGRTGAPLAVIMLDIDHFKGVNDTHGHDVGDTVLRAVARVLGETVRTIDVVARVGGEEFLAICPNTDEESGLHVAERLRAGVEAMSIEAGSFSGNVTISLGLAVHHGTVQGTSELLKLADEAVYEAKRKGRNRVEIAGADEWKQSA